MQNIEVKHDEERKFVKLDGSRAFVTGMSFAIRPLTRKTTGECRLCQCQVDLRYLDLDLGGRVCEGCEPFLEAAETALVAANFWHPTDSLVFYNP